ncbi:alpha/beta hydrolase family protein [Sphingomonas aerolata]|uniref:alpha/beta hydrolase family protein n=1 Tax=Sphingomonas aerolata TaxID=185951 RepID=UPI002FE24EEA
MSAVTWRRGSRSQPTRPSTLRIESSARPDVAALMHAVQSMTLLLAHPGSRALLLGASPTPALENAHSTASNVTSATPPCLLVHAEDDRSVVVENTLAFRAAAISAGVAVETHLFATEGMASA